MKKSPGIRVRRKLLSVWRWVGRRRRQAKRCNQLPQSSSPPSASAKQQTKQRRTLPAKIAAWWRFFSLLKRIPPGLLSTRDEFYIDYELLSERPPKPPPKGHLAVYVAVSGAEMPRRAVVPVAFFNHPLFAELLNKAEREFGYQHSGGITIPCLVSDFQGICTAVAAEVGSRRYSPRLLSQNRSKQ